MTLVLENDVDTLRLDEGEQTGHGIQALAGMTGLGLPPVAAQWLEGAGDGARYRGQRVLPREVDLPLDIAGRDRAHLQQLVSRLARMLSGPCRMVFIDEDGVRWSTLVVRVGGGDYPYTGGLDVQTTVTLRAPDPYLHSSVISTERIGMQSGQPFLSSLATLPVASSQAIGEISVDNPGDVDAYPTWEIVGPGKDLTLTSPRGESLRWTGTLAAGERLIIDTRAATVKDAKGANRYTLLDTAPRFWTLPPGISTAGVSLLDATTASRITCSWRPRIWMVI